jgi:hypothetical protein
MIELPASVPRQYADHILDIMLALLKDVQADDRKVENCMAAPFSMWTAKCFVSALQLGGATARNLLFLSLKPSRILLVMRSILENQVFPSQITFQGASMVQRPKPGMPIAWTSMRSFLEQQHQKR